MLHMQTIPSLVAPTDVAYNNIFYIIFSPFIRHFKCQNIQVVSTVKSAYKEPAYKELQVILGTDFHFPIFTSELVHYAFIRNIGYKEHIFMVPMSSL